jgi:two-component system, response regulator PdtaR
LPQVTTESDNSGSLAKLPRRVLVVEDEFFLAVQIEECLNDDGYDVIDVVHTAEEAVAVAIADRPDVVIMDIRLAQDGDGINAACEILARTGIRSIFATAHADAQTRSRGSIAQPLAWLEKPFGVEAILTAVDQAFRAPGG